MNAEIFRRIAWKEYRTLRGLWMILVLLTLLIQLLVYTSRVMVNGSNSYHLVELYAVALVFVALFALGASVILFAIEREEGTSDYLCALPTDPRALFVPKVVAALVGLLSLGLALALSTTALVAVLNRTESLQLDELMLLISQMGLIPFEVLAWGILFSMITRRTIVAACLGTAAASATVHLSAKLVAPDAVLLKDLHPYAAAVFPYRLSCLAVVIGMDVWLGGRWLRLLPPEDWFGIWRARRESTTIVDPALELRAEQPKPSQLVALRHLTWQAFRLARTPMLAIGGVGAILVFLLTTMNDVYDSPTDRTQWAALVAATIVALAGSCVFLGDHQRQRYRYFSERPVNTSALWVSRQLCWLSAVALLLVVGVAWWAFAVLSGDREFLTRPLAPGRHVLPGFVNYTGTLGEMPVWMAFGILMLLAFSAGQLCSMFFRSGILAAVFSVVLSGLFFGWVVLQECFGVTWLLSAAPLTLIAFFVSWLRTHDWIGERTGPRSWARAGSSVVISVGAMIAVLAYCRVAYVPVVEPGFSLADYAAKSTLAARETAAIYRRAGELLSRTNWSRAYGFNEARTTILNKRAVDGRSVVAELANLREQENEYWRGYLQENQAALKLFVEASARPSCAPDAPVGLTDDRSWRYESGEQLLLKDASFLRQKGDLNTALSRIMAALTMKVHREEHRIIFWRSNTVRDATAELMDWSLAPGQTPQRIREAIAALATWEKSLPPPDDQLMALYEWASGLLSGGSELRTTRPWSDWFDNADGSLKIALQLFPWERARAKRVLNLLTAQELQRSRQFFNSTGSSLTIDRARLDWESDRIMDQWMRSTVLLYAITADMAVNVRNWASQISTESAVRSTQIRLALVAWQIERGALPASLSDLVGPYFEQLPIDPNTGADYRYFPHGVKTELRWHGVDGPSELPAGSPLLWSSGSRLSPDQDPASPGVLQYWPVISQSNSAFPVNGAVLTEAEALPRGIVMPIPLPPAASGAKTEE